MTPSPPLVHFEDDSDEDNIFPRGVTMRKRRLTKGPIRNNAVDYSSFVCGLLAGVAQAGIFNPYDRALYLSVRDERRFLSLKNWQNPWNGYFQSIGGRAVSGGLFFPLEHLFLRAMDTELSHPGKNLIAGTAAGAVNGVLLNPFTTIKYKTWGREETRAMWTEAFGMIRKSGSFRPFFNGLVPTLYRDLVFGGVYTCLRLQIQWWMDLKPSEQYKANFVAAGLATIGSGPFNYVRNVQFATKSRNRADSTARVLRDLFEEAETKKGFQKWSFLQSRLRVGWGTLRVALGISFGHAIYDTLQRKIKEY
jgi:hypothetical protein